MTIQEILVKGTKILNKNNIDDAALTAKLLLSKILDFRKEELIIHSDDEVNKNDQEEFLNDIYRIAKGYPIQYLTEKKEFMKMDFFVNENVLIPRADTEILVEEVIKYCKGKKDLLELCTGSGAIRNINCKIYK